MVTDWIPAAYPSTHIDGKSAILDLGIAPLQTKPALVPRFVDSEPYRAEQGEQDHDDKVE
jgi:hypothetical protein